jgi:hypothetical protein
VDSPGIHRPDRDGLLTLLAGRTASLAVQEADIPCTSLLTSDHPKRTGQRAFGSGRRCGEHRPPGELVAVRLSLPDGHGSYLFGSPLRPLIPRSRSGSSASGLAANDRSFLEWLYSTAQPPAGPFDAPHLRIRHRLPKRIPSGNVSHTRKVLRDLLLVAFAVDADRCASVLGSLLAHKAR